MKIWPSKRFLQLDDDLAECRGDDNKQPPDWIKVTSGDAEPDRNALRYVYNYLQQVFSRYYFQNGFVVKK